MDQIQAEAIRILSLEREHSEHSWPPRLVFKSPDGGGTEPDKAAAVFSHLHATSSRSSGSVQTRLTPNATQQELCRIVRAAAEDRSDSGGGRRRAMEPQAAASSLSLAVVPRDGVRRHVLHMGRADFLDVFRSLRLDEYALYLYLTDTPGLHFLGRRAPMADARRAAAEGSPRPVLGFYLNVHDYAVIWSHDPRARATGAVVIGEADARWKTNQLLLQAARSVQPAQHARVFHHPLYPALLACAQGFLATWECDDHGNGGSGVGAGRRRTGNGTVGVRTMELDLDSAEEDLTRFSEACLGYGKSLAGGERSLRILRTLYGVAERLGGEAAPTTGKTAAMAPCGEVLGCLGSSETDESDYRAVLEQSTREIQDAMVFLKRQIASRIAHFEGHVRRAEVNLRLATSRIHRTEACLAKRDSKTMVSIALTTMAFLPATFMAALFDMQSATETMKSDFELYWKVALPLTALVFLCWDLTTGRVIQHRVLGPACERLADWRKKRESALRKDSGALMDEARADSAAMYV